MITLSKFPLSSDFKSSIKSYRAKKRRRELEEGTAIENRRN